MRTAGSHLCSKVSRNAKGYLLDAHFWNKKFAQFIFYLVIVNKLHDIHLCEKKTDYVSVIFRTGSRATHVVRVSNHVYAGTRLVTLVQTVLNNICLEDPL